MPELTETLQVSPAAISGAGRSLIQAGFLIKSRNPGDRLDSYSLGGDHWYEAVIARNPVYQRPSTGPGSWSVRHRLATELTTMMARNGQGTSRATG